jgi:hypothetical protein
MECNYYAFDFSVILGWSSAAEPAKGFAQNVSSKDSKPKILIISCHFRSFLQVKTNNKCKKTNNSYHAGGYVC